MNPPINDALASVQSPVLSTPQAPQQTTAPPRPSEAYLQASVNTAASMQPSQKAEGKNGVDTAELAESIQRINTVMSQRGLEFEIRQESDRVITRVIDRESGDVIRQIPAEEVLRLAERLDELQQGGLISLKV
ncbi:flagellar protein FlaG [Vreelandella aquamarina]